MLDLVAIEQIKQLKARYFRGIDTCDLDLLRSILAPDVKISFDSPTYQFELNGLEEAIDFYRSNFTPRRFGMHNGHTPEIIVNGDDATGLWYLNDLFINLDQQTMLNGSAIYEDHYVKVQGEWRILRTGYKRLLEMVGPWIPNGGSHLSQSIDVCSSTITVHSTCADRQQWVQAV